MLESIGVLLQGTIFDWTKKIVEEYNRNFPNSEILLSTDSNQNTDGIQCKIIKVDPPSETEPHSSRHVNHQKIGALAGLEIMSSKIVMKCRTDQFIHNKKIFEIYENSCPVDKIMIPNYPTFEMIDYWASEDVQIATREILIEFWESVPFFDGSFPVHSEIWHYGNYILNGKKDLSPWRICLRKYFYVKGFHEDFHIEWKKLKENLQYQKNYKMLYPECMKPEP